MTDPPLPNGHTPLATWLWLAEPRGWDRALVVGGAPGGLAAELARRFADVQRLDLFALDDPTGPTRAAADGAVRLPYGDGSFDCVALHDVLGRLASRLGTGSPEETAARVLVECRRVLRNGGCLYAAAGNPWWHGHLGIAAPLRTGGRAERPAPPSPSAIARLLRRAGFRYVTAYWADPSHDQPLSLIPATRVCVRVYEGQESSRTSVFRRILAGVGLAPLLYRSQVLVACA